MPLQYIKVTVVVSALQYVLRALPDQPAAVGSANELF
jgi:hypothetical protein